MHELVAACASAGLPLHRTLTEMLGEDPSHRTERRGCGYTQATRFLATYVNQPRAAESAGELAVFREWRIGAVEELARAATAAGWPFGWRRLQSAPDEVRRLAEQASPEGAALLAVAARLESARRALRLAESLVLADMISDLVSGSDVVAPRVPAMAEKPDIGSCSQAEEFFLELAHGRVRRHGHVNIIVDAANRAILLEKMNLGESLSAIAIEPIIVNDVLIPPGGLFALRYQPPPGAKAIPHGQLLPLHAIREARFLRLTTLAVPPEIRRRTFSAQVDAQIHARMMSPLTTTLDDLRNFVGSELRQAA